MITDQEWKDLCFDAAIAEYDAKAATARALAADLRRQRVEIQVKLDALTQQMDGQENG